MSLEQQDAPTAARPHDWIRAHPLVSFFVLAYSISWTAWGAAYLGLGMAGVVVGGFGPMAAAWIVTRSTGGSVHAWARQIIEWRVAPRFYLYALGLPVLLWGVMNLALAMLGEPVSLSSLGDRTLAYLGTLVFVSILGGGFEEPGWRGFALARLQRRHTPVRATLVLAFFWGLWHLPLYGVAFVVPMLYAFFYTYLFNRTRSVLLCIVLHGGFTAALDHLILTRDNMTVDLVILATLVAATLALIGLSHGRLGYEGEGKRSMTEPRLHVVLGAGPLGLAVARHLLARDERLQVVNTTGRAELPLEVPVVAANIAEPEEAIRACMGADVVYHCANPPYAKWPELHPPLMSAIIEGAGAAQARVVFGDNLYAYGPVEGPMTETLPYRATGPNGLTRAGIAQTLMQAHEAGRVEASIGRGSDFFGPHAHLSTVGDRVFARAIQGKPAQVLGRQDVPHAVTYLEDFGRALVTLGEREEAQGQVWHVPHAPAVTMRRFVDMAFEEAGSSPRLRSAPRWGIAAASVFSPTMRAVQEQLYQSERPWLVDSSKFEGEFGWQATPLQDAIAATIAWFRSQEQV